VTLVGEVFVSAVLVIFRSELRRRWRSWVILVVLVAVVGGLTLAAVAAGRRTASAFGQVVWHAFSANLGAVPVSIVPVGVLALLGAGVLVVANVLAFIPAVAAARSTTSGELFWAL
jgi:hypothetical protein